MAKAKPSKDEPSIETQTILSQIEAIDKAARTPKLAALKREGPYSNIFKRWRYETEDLLIHYLGEKSVHTQRFRQLYWLDDVDYDDYNEDDEDRFRSTIDEAKIILECASVELARQSLANGKVTVNLPKGQFPIELERILNEIKVCANYGALTASVVMSRKAVEVAIHLRFAKEGKENMLLTGKGDTLGFENKIEIAQANGFLSPSKATQLKQVKWFGDSGAHSYKIVITQDDASNILALLRLSLEELFPA